MQIPNLIFHSRSYDEADVKRWTDLFVRSKTSNLFYHPCFLESAIQVWPKYKPDIVVEGYKGDQLVLLQPLKVHQQIFGKTLQILSLPTADRIEPLVSSENSRSLIELMVDYCKQEFTPDLIIGSSLTKDFCDILVCKFSDRIVEGKLQAKGAIMELPPTIDEYWSALKSKSRNKLKRKIKKAREAGLTFRMVQPENMPSGYDMLKALENLNRLHSMRFSDLNRDSFFVKPDYQQFHQFHCENPALADRTVTFTEALHEGQVVGSLYGMRTSQVYIYFMVGFDPKYAEFSPGNLMIYYTIEDLIRHGVKIFDFKCGDESYKWRWTKAYYQKYKLYASLTVSGDLLVRYWRLSRLSQKIGKIPEKVIRLIFSI